MRARSLRGAALGVAAGVFSGLFGVGGGLVIVPGLVLLLAVNQHIAHATSLAAILFIAPAALLGFALEGEVAYLAAALLSVGAIVGAYLGAGLMHRVSSDRLRQAFAVLVLLVAVRMALPIELVSGGGDQAVDLLRGLAFLGVGLGTGVLSALMGVGGGLVLVPAMVLLFSFSQHTAEGTSLLVIIPTALVGAIRHARRGYTDWRLGLAVGVGGIAGGLVGAQVALALDSDILQLLFALFLAATGVRMLRGREQPKQPRRALR